MALLATGLILAFGAKINWKIRPISVEKELKNTRMMGIFMAVMAVITLFLIILKVLK
ncbi:MAG: hypothetical protein NTW09_02020 [Candidatus Omnitrophica bacterium]|nr:hypothetical protein [Candidatus Omnitrophota bacterium]